MAHVKAGSSTKLGRDSNPQFRGLKKSGGEKIKAGQIILRQLGTKWMPNTGVKLGGDNTIYALIDGIVTFEHKYKTSFTGKKRKKVCVSVYPQT
jgi:large subunit ribosomal protein L27